MPWLNRSLHNKLIAGSILAVLALILLPIIYGWSAMEQAETYLSVRKILEVIDRAERLQVDLAAARDDEIGWLATGDRRYVEGFRKHQAAIVGTIPKLEEAVGDKPTQAGRVVVLEDQIQQWLAGLSARGADVAGAEDVAPRPEDVTRMFSQDAARASLDPILQQIEEFVDAETEHLVLRDAENGDARSRNMAVVLIGTSLALASFVALSFWLARSIIDPIRELTAATEAIHHGDLDVRVADRGGDELGQLGKGFNAMAASLSRSAKDLERRDVQAGVLQVAQVLAASNDLPHLLDRTIEKVLEVSRCEAGAIWIRHAEDETLRPLVAIGTGSEILDSGVRLGDGILGRVAQTRIAYFAPADSEAAPLLIRHWNGDRRPAEVAYVPLSSGPDLVGVLTLASTEPIDERIKNLLRIISGQLGSAIRDALTHQALQRQAVVLEARNKELAERRGEIERQNRELRVASQLKSEFLANMSHELRTPLTIVLGFTNTVLRGAQGPLTDAQRDSLKRVYDNARHLLGLINDILDLSKIEAGQMEIEPETFDPGGTLEAIADNFRPMAEGKGLRVRVDRAGDLPDRIVADETRFRQVITNLASNAVKFTDHGEVAIVGRRGERGTVEFQVRDTGPGIASEDLPKIFDQFRQLDGRTNRRAGGTGLGLSIVKRLVELMGGELIVESTVGVGSSFTVRLPIQQGEVRARPALTEASAIASTLATLREGEDPERPSTGRLVLAIDDDEDFLALLRAAFAATPFSLRCTDSGREGLELAEQLRPDAITLDLMMPDMDGWRVLGALKANPTTASIPVILLSVLQRKGLGLMLGASDYLTKPLDRDQLIRSLRSVVAPGAGGTILVVDDDPDIRKMLDVELRSEGFDRVETAADGIEGLRKARELTPDLVILDLMMPNMDGFEMAARLQQDDATRGIPIIVLTAKDLTSADIGRLNGQIEEIIQKGAFSVDSLINRLVEILRALGVRSSRA